MSVAYWLTPLVIIMLILYLVHLRRRSLSRQTGPDESPYHCVSVLPGRNACKAVRALKRARYFPAEAPPLLPVPGCTAESCQCRYKHHADRRYRSRRNANQGTVQQLSAEPDRRAASGRRRSDKTAPNSGEPTPNPRSTGKTPK